MVWEKTKFDKITFQYNWIRMVVETIIVMNKMPENNRGGIEQIWWKEKKQIGIWSTRFLGAAAAN